MQLLSVIQSKKLSPEQLFMVSVLAVNGGNYLYNLVLGRLLGPAQFADAAVLITFLLVLSFIAMTYQLVTAKFSVLLDNSVFRNFITIVYKQAFIVGVVLGGLLSTLGLIIYLTKVNIVSSMLLIPYFGWLLFATMLNYSIVNM